MEVIFFIAFILVHTIGAWSLRIVLELRCDKSNLVIKLYCGGPGASNGEDIFIYRHGGGEGVGWLWMLDDDTVYLFSFIYFRYICGLLFPCRSACLSSVTL